MGQLTAFEMTSSMSKQLYSNGSRRLGYNQDARLFFDERVEADAGHQLIAARTEDWLRG